ncbi:MAG: dihydrodipicolinate synthase family protein [Fimbriimonadaceae bacterium]|nr:dihydrodipicolinate synthase family protein [Fimbriimonadaceae bacterium]
MAQIRGGIMPASVTPFDENGRIDFVSLAKLFSYFEACGCSGVVVAGTNGEGPSLSAVEKRDLVKEAVQLTSLPVILGIATPSLDEANWLCSQAGKSGAAGILLMPPGYFKVATESGTMNWMKAVADSSPIPVIAYNFPKYSGFTMSPDFVAELAQHPNVLGFKDSSGEVANLSAYRKAAVGKVLLVGDETLLLQSLEAGWNGSISGAANLVPHWLVRIYQQWHEDSEKAEVKFKVLVDVLSEIRRGPQPALNKASLSEWGVIARSDVRLPLEKGDCSELLKHIEDRLGINSRNLAIPKIRV